MDTILFLLFICFIICLGLLSYAILDRLIFQNMILNLYKNAVIGGKSINRIVIIVPYGNLHPEEKRDEQLKQFIEHMPDVIPKNINFDIIIAEQIKPEKYFNRGQLINIAIKYTIDNDKPDLLVIHDVDMLPDKILVEQYINNNDVTCLVSNALLRRDYSSKNLNNNTCSGITSIKPKIFKDINGYPNDFWGWGGEDIALLNRLKLYDYKLVYNNDGTYKNIDIQRSHHKSYQKIVYLKKNKIKNMMRDELVKEDTTNYMNNGYNKLTELKYEIEDKNIDKLSKNIRLIQLKIKLDEMRLDETIEWNEKIYNDLEKSGNDHYKFKKPFENYNESDNNPEKSDDNSEKSDDNSEKLDDNSEKLDDNSEKLDDNRDEE